MSSCHASDCGGWLPEDYVILEPATGSQPEALVVMLHGFRDAARGMIRAAETLQQHLPQAVFLLPSAPNRSWYSTDADGHLTGHLDAGRQVLETVEGILAKHSIPWNRVAFAGFSQGSMLASWVALQLQEICGGLVMWMGGAPMELQVSTAARHTWLLLIAGEQDGVVPISLTRQCRDLLTSWRMSNFQYLELPGVQHKLSAAVLRLSAAFLCEALQLLPASAANSDSSAPSLQSFAEELKSLAGGSEEEISWHVKAGAAVTVLTMEDARGIVTGYDADRSCYDVQLHSTGAGVSEAEEERRPASVLRLQREEFVLRMKVLSVVPSLEEKYGEEMEVIGVDMADDGGVSSLKLKLGSSKDEQSLPQAPHKVVYPKGMSMKLGGLGRSGRLAKAEGKVCVVKEYFPAESRYAVQVDGEEGLVRVRPRNLIP